MNYPGSLVSGCFKGSATTPYTNEFDRPLVIPIRMWKRNQKSACVLFAGRCNLLMSNAVAGSSHRPGNRSPRTDSFRARDKYCNGERPLPLAREAQARIKIGQRIQTDRDLGKRL